MTEGGAIQRRIRPTGLGGEQEPGHPQGFKLGSLEERAPFTETSSPGQEGGRREHGALFLNVLALNSQEGPEDASLGFQKRSRQEADLGASILHPSVTVTRQMRALTGHEEGRDHILKRSQKRGEVSTDRQAGRQMQWDHILK